DRALDSLGVMLLLVGSVPVALAGRWPVAMYLVALVGIDVYQALGYTVTSPYFLGLLLTAYAAAAPGRWRRSAALALLSCPLFVLGGLARGRVELGFAVPVLACAAFAAGEVASELRAASERQSRQARREADLLLVAEERLRIARELHDVVSHTIATIGIQAGVAAHVLDREPEQAREALAA